MNNAPAPPECETVILLHGLGRSWFSMAPLARALRQEGYRVLNVPYRSRTRSLDELASSWLPRLVAENAPGSRLHFVTHSMGGILVRLWLRHASPPANLGRVVMLAPPNAGSEIPDQFAGFPPFRWWTGVNGARLGTGPDALPRMLGPWPAPLHDLGIIAGEHAGNPLLSRRVARPHDGKVSVASTHLAGERDHCVLPYSHTWLAWHRATIARVSAFLRDGTFGIARS